MRDKDFEPIDRGENRGVNRSREPHIGSVIERRFGRRAALRGLAGAAAAAAVGSALRAPEAQAGSAPSTLTFREIEHTLDAQQHLPEGYEAQTLVRWGDPVTPGAPAFDAARQSAAAQAQQLGYNCDYVGWHPLPQGSASSDHGVLAINCEYSNAELMFPGLGAGSKARLKASREQAEIEIAAHGMAFVEVRKQGGRWSVVADGKYGRRITGTTPMRVSGPAAGHDKLKTSADPTGRVVLGTLNNCAGGDTPWGTTLTAEENFNLYFDGDVDGSPDRERYRRYRVIKEPTYSWSRHFDRFDVAKEPNEPNRFGWIVEIDPYDPSAQPVKRTALGRFKHEGCHHAIAKDGRVVVYSGDDERFEYVYKFVSARPWSPTDRAANRDLLDEGVLYVARFGDDGKVTWLPLVHGQGPLTAENGFRSQADVLIETRRAADLLKPTPMDRPEDVEADPRSGRVYIALTNNSRRTAQRVDRANPRADNEHGHVLEMIPAGGDHAALEGTWSLFLAAGKPGIDAGTLYHRATSEHGWLSCPDNVAIDPLGRLWISTDGAPAAAGVADGLYAADTQGYGRGLTRLFYQAPDGAEVCGPCFTPDGKTLFLAIQHPGEGAGSTFDKPNTRWPDFAEGMPPRPSVIAVVRKDGGDIGA